MRIVFMGTPEIAAAVLAAISDAGHDIAGVVTQPDKPKGRGYNLTPPPVKVEAERRGIPVFQPEKIRTEEFARLLEGLAPELIIVVAYGKILPANVLALPKYGCVNAHASLLPKYRGSAPIQRAIMNGERETGVTAMYMDEGVDTGDMISSIRVPIGDGDDFGVVHDKLAAAAAELMVSTTAAIEAGTAERTPQPDGATYAPKITNDDMKLDFTKSAESLANTVRALSPSPSAYATDGDGRRLRVLAAEWDDADSGVLPGVVASVAGGRIAVGCGRGTLYILRCQPEGKRPMTAADLCNGRRIRVGNALT